MNPESFRQIMWELRGQEESRAASSVRRVRGELAKLRASITALEETIAQCEGSAASAFACGRLEVGRGTRREINGLRLLRSRQIGRLAYVKARLMEAEEELRQVRQQKQGLGVEYNRLDVNEPAKTLWH